MAICKKIGDEIVLTMSALEARMLTAASFLSLSRPGDVDFEARRYRGMKVSSSENAVNAHNGIHNALADVVAGMGEERPLNPALTDAEKYLLDGGFRLQAIQLLRNRTGLGVKEAKDAVEAAQ